MHAIKPYHYKFGVRPVVTKFGLSLLKKIGHENKPENKIKKITNISRENSVFVPKTSSDFLWTIGKDDMKEFICKLENEHRYIKSRE